MEYIGKYAEHLVLAKLLGLGIEAYLAIKSNQDHYDITVITADKRVIRVQVKSTKLENESTNNPISNIDKEYDFLVLVIVTGNSSRHFVLTKSEAFEIKGDNRTMYTSFKEKKSSKIKDVLLPHEDKWTKLFCS